MVESAWKKGKTWDLGQKFNEAKIIFELIASDEKIGGLKTIFENSTWKIERTQTLTWSHLKAQTIRIGN